jgi:hypothetical protein
MINGTTLILKHWYAEDLLKQYPSKGDAYVIDEELQHTNHLFFGVACFTFLNFVVKEGQQKYCETVYSRSGINHMWILKNSKDLLDNRKSRSFSQVSSIKTFD